jgi:hypothetical protein
MFKFLAAILLLVPHLYALTPREELSSLGAQLLKTPSDDVLRDKIIALAKKLKPPVPEAARRAFIRGTTAFTSAKNPSGFTRAAERFEEASNIAPWWSDAYFNLAKAFQASQDYDASLRALKLYMATASSKADLRQGQDMIYAVEELRDAKKSETAAATPSLAKCSIVGAWQVLEADGKYYPFVEIARDGSLFAVKSNFLDAMAVTVHHADEMTVRYSFNRDFGATGGSADFDMHCEGDALVGTQTHVFGGSKSLIPRRMVRK